jgi:hypothetical protein
MELPRTLMAPRFDDATVTRLRRICDAILASSKAGLDAGVLVEAFNDATANAFSAHEIVEQADLLGAEGFVCWAMSPPVPTLGPDEATRDEWTEVVRRVRAREGTPFERMWWLELISRASGRDDAADVLLGAADDDPANLLDHLLGATAHAAK